RKSGGVPDAVESIEVRHSSGGVSRLGFKSYDQGRRSFQGTFKHGIWLDEEPPWLVYEECLLRIVDTSAGTEGGMLFGTFTPLLGMSDVVMHFLGGLEDNEEGIPDAVVQIGMRDVPHISAEEREAILSKLPPHQRKAREYGIPTLGSGAIYPVDEEEITFDAFEYPPHWTRGYGFDVGWNNTAAIWCAYDRDTDILRVVDEYKAGEKLPAVHASAIKARGEWQPGVIDPASKGHSANDGKRLVKLYKGEGLKIELAERQQRESGILECLNRFTTGRLLIASHCVKTLAEFRVYRRDEKGNVVKKNDHLMDAMRYRVLDLKGMRLPRPARVRYHGIRSVR
ncbi:MAG: terminase family protein, partial [Myxococcota bacterium]|nr:terminase family protein [Myxococcota bacterium]